MQKNFRWILFLVLLLSAASYGTDTWRIDEGAGTAVSATTPEGQYYQGVHEIRKLIWTGKTTEALKAAEKLQKDFAGTADAGFVEFVKGEILYSRGKYTKAVRQFDTFFEKYPESKFYNAALDREFEIGTAFLGGQKKKVLFFRVSAFDDGVKVMERIADRAGDAPIAVDALTSIVNAYEKKSKYEEAYSEWSIISSRWPTGKIGEEALLGMARNKHAGYRGPKYDASGLVSAKTYYENYKQRYPEQASAYEIDSRLKQIEEQLAYKEYVIGSYYQAGESYKPAKIYYDWVKETWPGSTGAKMAARDMEKVESCLQKEKQ